MITFTNRINFYFFVTEYTLFHYFLKKNKKKFNKLKDFYNKNFPKIKKKKILIKTKQKYYKKN